MIKHFSNCHLWIVLAELTDDVAVGALEDLFRRLHLFHADRALKEVPEPGRPPRLSPGSGKTWSSPWQLPTHSSLQLLQLVQLPAQLTYSSFGNLENKTCLLLTSINATNLQVIQVAFILLLNFPLVRLVHLIELVPVSLLLLQDLLVLTLDLLHDHLSLLGDLLLQVVLREEVIQLLQNGLGRNLDELRSKEMERKMNESTLTLVFSDTGGLGGTSGALGG